MKKVIVEHKPTKLHRPFQRRMDMSTMEVFLDFDPVFPGWPPDNGLRDAAQEPQKGDLKQRAAS